MEATNNNPVSLLDALFQVFNAQAAHINDNANSQKLVSQREERKSSIVALVNFLGYTNLAEFQNIFGESLGAHLWAKFYSNGKYSYNFLNQVSNHNLIILENYLRRM
jgi:hypothetical protein